MKHLSIEKGLFRIYIIISACAVGYALYETIISAKDNFGHARLTEIGDWYLDQYYDAMSDVSNAVTEAIVEENKHRSYRSYLIDGKPQAAQSLDVHDSNTRDEYHDFLYTNSITYRSDYGEIDYYYTNYTNRDTIASRERTFAVPNAFSENIFLFFIATLPWIFHFVLKYLSIFVINGFRQKQ